MLKQRLVTAFFLVLILLGSLFFTSPRIFCLLTLIVAMGATWEWTLLMGLKKTNQRVFYCLISLSLYLSLFLIPIPIYLCINLFYLTLFFWILTIPLIYLYPRALFWKDSVILESL